MKFKENIPLKNFTTFKIGGPARYFCIAKNQKEIIDAIKKAKDFDLPFFILAGGSNILVSDKGYKGLVINFQFSLNSETITKSETTDLCFNFQKNKIIAGAGTKLRELVNASVNRGLTGLEWAVGIPGTIGGAVYGNIGAFGSIMGDNVENVKVLNIKNLKIGTLSNKECKFSNKDSVFKQNKNFIILSILLKLKKGEKEEISQKIKRFSIYRKKNHPLDFPSAGCIFKNYNKKIINKKLLKKYPELIEFNKGSRIPTSYLIDKCGLKGKKIGKAQISEKHANFIINLGRAKSEDVIKLIKTIKQKVKNKFGIKLEEEIQYFGF